MDFQLPDVDSQLSLKKRNYVDEVNKLGENRLRVFWKSGVGVADGLRDSLEAVFSVILF